MNEWKKTLISEVVWFQEGPGVRKNQYTTAGVKLINVANLQDGKIDLTTSERYISVEEANGRYKHFLVDPGDFIIASSGIKVEYFEKKMGFISQDQLPLCMNTSTIRFKSIDEEELDMRFFMYCLKTKQFKEELVRQITGSAQLNFGPSHLKKMKIYYPRICKQKQIVEVLDKANFLMEKRKLQIEKLDLLINSQFIEMFGKCREDKSNWVKSKLQDFCHIGSSKRVFTKEIVERGIPFLRGTEVGELAEEKLVKPKLFITKTHYEELKKYTGVPALGDLLLPSICRDGRIWQVDTEEPFYFKDGRVLWIHIKGEISSTYLLYVLKEKLKCNYDDIASGTTFSELKIFALKDVKIPIPPIELQNQFANFVNKVEKTKATLQQSLTKMEQNYKSLMQKCFRGEIF